MISASAAFSGSMPPRSPRLPRHTPSPAIYDFNVHGNEVYIALTAPGTPAEVNAVLQAASKYGITNIIVANRHRERVPVATFTVSSRTQVHQVEDVLDYLDQLSVHEGFVLVGIHRQQRNVFFVPIVQFRHPPRVVYCIEPEGYAVDGAEETLRLCQQHTFVDQSNVTKMASVALFDRYQKEKRGLSSSSERIGTPA
jgi:hypothetical protein